MMGLKSNNFYVKSVLFFALDMDILLGEEYAEVWSIPYFFF